ERLGTLAAVYRELFGEKSKRIALLVFEHDHPLEAIDIVGCKRIDQLFDRRIDHPKERHTQQIAFAALKYPPPNHIGRERTDHHEGGGSRQDPKSRDAPSDQTIVERRRQTVDDTENPDERRHGDEKGYGDEKASDEVATKPIHGSTWGV